MKKIGVVGAGQLGLMLGQAGEKLGVECIFLDPADNPPAAAVGEVLKYAFDDMDGLQKLLAASDLITYEFENVPVAAMEALCSDTTVFPPPSALRSAQDRLVEKEMFLGLDIPVPRYQTVDSDDDLRNACYEIGLPLVIKTRRMGYDGKGQMVMRRIAEIEKVMQTLGNADLIAEEMVPFDREVSAIGARSQAGDIVCYPLTENHHEEGILRTSRALVDPGPLADVASEYLDKLLRHLNYVGVVALELFEIDGQLKANEFAPRVHNSGHWTIEGSTTSQFENHLRAALDDGLGAVDMTGTAGMINLIGSVVEASDLQEIPDTYLHLYGKEPRPGRKLGHITILAEDENKRESTLIEVGKLLNT